MIPKDVLKEIKRIEIRTTRLVNDLFGGEYESVFKGRGIDLRMCVNMCRAMTSGLSIGT